MGQASLFSAWIPPPHLSPSSLWSLGGSLGLTLSKRLKRPDTCLTCPHRWGLDTQLQSRWHTGTRSWTHSSGACRDRVVCRPWLWCPGQPSSFGCVPPWHVSELPSIPLAQLFSASVAGGSSSVSHIRGRSLDARDEDMEAGSTKYSTTVCRAVDKGPWEGGAWVRWGRPHGNCMTPTPPQLGLGTGLHFSLWCVGRNSVPPPDLVLKTLEYPLSHPSSDGQLQRTQWESPGLWGTVELLIEAARALQWPRVAGSPCRPVFDLHRKNKYIFLVFILRL